MRGTWAWGLIGTIILAVIAWRELDERTSSLLVNTAALAARVILIALPIGVLLALFLRRTDGWGRRGLGTIMIAMLFVPLYLQAAGWDAWLGRQGWLRTMQDDPSRRMWAAAWIHALAAVPWIVVIVGAGLRHLSSELEELAILQMPARHVLWRVTLPLCAPAILLAAWYALLMVAGDMTVTDIYQVRTYAEEIYSTIPLLDPSAEKNGTEVTLPRGEWWIAVVSALSVLVLIRFAFYEFPFSAHTSLRWRMGTWKWPVTGGAWIVGTLLVAIPLVNLAYDAGMDYKPMGDSVKASWSPVKLVSMVVRSPWSFRRELGWTVLLSATAATVAMAIAIPWAWGARAGKWSSVPALLMAAVAASIPGPMVGLALMRLLNRPESDVFIWLYDRTITAPVLAMACRALPAAFLVSWWGCRTVPAELVELARLDGLGVVGQFRHVVWPLRRDTLVAAWLIAAALAAGDLAASLLVTPPGISTLALRIFGLLHAGVDDQVAGLCLANLLCFVLLGMSAQYFLSRERVLK